MPTDEEMQEAMGLYHQYREQNSLLDYLDAATKVAFALPKVGSGDGWSAFIRAIKEEEPA